MSLHIDVATVDVVLLADGWHQVDSRSFDLDAYEFHHNNETILGGGQAAGIPSTSVSDPVFNKIVAPSPLRLGNDPRHQPTALRQAR